MRRLVIAVLLISCDRGEPTPSPVPPVPTPTPTPPPAPAATHACPPEDWRNPITRVAVWPRCPIDPPFATVAARCAKRGCMRPCRREDGFPGKPPDALADYTYDGAGNLTGTKTRATKTGWMTCEYDGHRARVCTFESGAIDRYEFEADRLARVRSTFDGGKKTGLETYEYDTDGRLVRATVKFGEDPERIELYSYDPQGRLIRISERAPSGRMRDEIVKQFSYDALGRYIGVKEEWFDDQGKVSNRSTYGTQWLAYDAQGRVGESTSGLTAADRERNKFTYSYDTSGRLATTVRVFDGYAVTYFYECK